MMTLNNVFQFLVPKDKKFFPLFEQAAANLILLAETLHEAIHPLSHTRPFGKPRAWGDDAAGL